MFGKKAYWICQTSGWLLYTLVVIILVGISEPLMPAKILAHIITCFMGMLFSHGYRQIIKHNSWTTLPLINQGLRIILASIIIAFLWGLTSLSWNRYISHTLTWSEINPTVLFIIWFNWSAVIFIWSLIYFSLHYFEHVRRAEVEKWRLQASVKEAELRALKAQMSPHFIFNSLNSMRGLISEDPQKAQDALTKLANILRYSLQSGQKETVSLEQELQMVSDYLMLEQIRFEERLTVKQAIEPQTLAAQIPPMAIQTLVENAVKHGIAKRREGGIVSIKAWLMANRVHIQVINDGHLINEPNSLGMGIKNTRERLELLFGNDSSFSMTENASVQVVVEFTIPLNKER